ncbi:MarR family transcriptional regulator [Pseudoduganella ginsengisoli]|uniref:Winged helix DNA-binding protein n=1 Tax=Pseudoduganella ginsengisoli TaxID=1462440 RepID=A0A6L6Q4C3_9BURK|nr:MarR family transcriptional regulator [Pseudoduganella ginsengisoli]MTW03922.1 winged helix DNA-binding protein [Pseudoduganella ginsengisoli]
MSQSNDERFAIALHTTARMWRVALDRRLKDLGMGQASWMTIATVAKGEPLSQTELASRIGVEDPTMVSMIDRLVKAGYLVRTPSDKDRRVKLVSLTDGGREIYARVKAEAEGYRNEILGDADAAKLAEVADFLEAVQRKIEARL